MFENRTSTNLTLLLLFLLLAANGLFGQSEIWVGSWSCAPYAAGSNNTPPFPFLANNTLRQVVRVSIGGDNLRVKFSNKTSSTPVTMKSVNIAVSTGASSINTSTLTSLKFNGNSSVTMDAFSSITSDPVSFSLIPSMRVAITINYGEAVSSANMTSHVASRTDSYLVTGDQSSEADFGGATITAHWFHINTIDVMAPDTAGAVGILGNSITDGYGLSGGLQNRWTDFLSQSLLDDERTENVGVLNLGIGGTNVAGGGATTGLSRYKDDLLTQYGLRWIIIFYGTNDINAGASANTITNADQQIIDDAHARNVKVYGATITPFEGSGHYSVAHEVVRNAVNNWIRTPGNFDAVIDFDMAIRDPLNITRLKQEFSNDWLHPNVKGYEFLGNYVDLNLFTDIVSDKTLFANAGLDQTLVVVGNGGTKIADLYGSNSTTWGSPIDSFIWSENGVEIASGEQTTVELSIGIHNIKLTITDKNGKTDTDNVVITVKNDSGIWLEAECGIVGSLWDIVGDETASNGKYVTVKDGNNSTSSAPSSATGLITYTFEVENNGTYDLIARLICPSPIDDSFWIKMDDGSFAMWNNIDASTWRWVNFTSGFSLTKGSHTLTIAYREDGAKLDKLWITNNGADLSDEGSNAANCTTSSKNNELNPYVNIYPNPVSGELSLYIENAPANISIYDNNGKEVSNQDTENISTTINMENFQSGIYFFKITDTRNTVVKKIIKN